MPDELPRTLRDIVVADLPAVLQNERRAYQFPWTQGVFEDCLQRTYECRLLLEGDEVLGHAIASVAAGESHLLNLCIRRDEQGRGLGRELLLDVLQRLHERGASMVFLEVRPSNLSAIALYDSIGFGEIGVRKNYYPAAVGYEDALVMGLDFSAANCLS